jgi:hypothetical protein
MTTTSREQIEASTGARPFDADEHLALYKFKMLTDIKDEILVWAKVRLGILTTLLSLLILTGSFVGIRLLVERQIDKIAREPVESQIKILQEAGLQAKERVEALRFQSEQVTSLSLATQHELTRLKAEADQVRKFVKETEITIQAVERTAKDLKAEAERFKQGADVSRQHFHEQALKTKGDMLLMRNNVELLQSGFQIIEKLAAEIRQKDPQSELAQQFASFGAEWRTARDAYQKRATVIKSRRDVKVIHYLRQSAPQERHRLSEAFVDRLLDEGYTAEPWTTSAGANELEAAIEVGKEFGIDPKVLLSPVLIASPSSKASVEDLKDIARKAGLKLPGLRRIEFAPKKSLIERGGENGSFEPTNIVLIAELTEE